MQDNDLPNDLTTQIHEYYHDLQYFVGALGHLSVVKISQRNDLAFMRNRLDEIHGFSVIMSAKTNFLKYLTAPATELNLVDIQVHRVLKKIISGAKQVAKSKERHLKFSLTGESFGSILGPDTFEFIPFLILENAIKYSPSHGEVAVDVRETNDEIGWRIDSLGPEILPTEIDQIFEKGFRGENAIRYTNQGSGMGLYHVKTAIDKIYHGSIMADQRTDVAAIHVGGIPFRRTSFSITIRKNQNI